MAPADVRAQFDGACPLGVASFLRCERRVHPSASDYRRRSVIKYRLAPLLNTALSANAKSAERVISGHRRLLPCKGQSAALIRG